LKFSIRKSREEEEEGTRAHRHKQDNSSNDRDSSSLNKFQNLENPPMERAPSPPTNSSKSSMRHGSSTLNFAKPVSLIHFLTLKMMKI
jgi:hypothetical protein